MPRLLVLCEYPTLLGGERSMLATFEAVRAADFEIRVAAPPAGPLADALNARGITHVPWHVRDDTDCRYSLEELRSDLVNIFAAERPDLVHANSLSTARIAGPAVAAAGLRGIGHLRDIISLSNQAVTDLNCLDRLIAVSAATREYHVTQGVEESICRVTHNGVDLEEFKPRPATGYLHRELNLPPAAQLIATIGQLGLRKGTDVAVAAAALVAEHVPEVHWLVVGERTSDKQESREFEARLHVVADRPPLAGQVHLLGVRNDVPQLLNECTLLVHAARQEPLGRVLLESAAAGLAVVATDVGGTREVFPLEADSAVLVPADDSSILAEEVTKLLREEACREALARAARRRAEAAFDIRTAGPRLVEHFREVLAG